MEDIINPLNNLLADLNVYYRKLQNYHWNIEGVDFFQVHAKLEEYYNEINVQIDEIAEHILTIGGTPLGTLKDYISIARLQEAQNKKVDSKYVFTNVTKDLEILLSKVIEIKEKSDDKKDYGTSAKMDEYINNYSKQLWMLKQMQNIQ